MTKQETTNKVKKQKKDLEEIFRKNFGVSFEDMKKQQLAFMVYNQSRNIVKIDRTAQEVVKIGLAMKRQRDWYHKLIRSIRHG